jgi:hypothetical protein
MGAPRGNRKAATGGRHGHGGRFNAKYLRALVIARRARIRRSVSSIGCAVYAVYAGAGLCSVPRIEQRSHLPGQAERMARSGCNRCGRSQETTHINSEGSQAAREKLRTRAPPRAQGTFHWYIRTHMHTSIHACKLITRTCIHVHRHAIYALCKFVFPSTHVRQNMPRRCAFTSTHMHVHQTCVNLLIHDMRQSITT